MVVVVDHRIEVVNSGPPAKRVLIEDIKDVEVAHGLCGAGQTWQSQRLLN